MRTLLLMTLAVAGLATAAQTCPNTLETTLTVSTPAGTFYVWNDPCQTDGCLFSIWIFPESNGFEGYQYADCIPGADCTTAPRGEWCDPDGLLF